MILDDLLYRQEQEYADPQGMRFQRGINLFTGMMPDSPDLVLAMYEYPGLPPGYTMSGGRAYENQRVQLLLRGPPGEYSNTRVILERTIDIFDGLTGEIINSTLYHRIELVSEVFTLPVDNMHRVKMSADLSIIKGPSPLPT